MSFKLEQKESIYFSQFVTIDKETKEQQTSNLPEIPEKLFESMIDNEGYSVSDYNKKGFKVLLFFVSFIGCANCQGTLDDIVDLTEQLFLLNVIPIVVHNEDEETFQEWANESEQTQNISKKILHFQRTKEIKKYFKLNSVSTVKYLTDSVGNLAAAAEVNRLALRGLKLVRKFMTKETSKLLAACFVVSNKKVISHFGKERKHQRFDLARIVIDTDGTGLEVHTDIFACDYMSNFKKKQSFKPIKENSVITIKKIKKKKSKPSLQRSNTFSFSLFKEKKVVQFKMDEVLENPKYRKFLKTFCTREYAVENVIFYEQVRNIKRWNWTNDLKDSNKS
jgi:hypothetical protein